MKSALAKKEIAATLTSRFGSIFELREKPRTEILSTGIENLDASLGGFPRGAITEIHGSASSGRTSLLLSTLAGAIAQEETCALVDCSDTFDPASTTNAGVDVEGLLWIRCGGNLERAFKATDLLLQSGGFGLVALNLADVPARNVRRIISSWWFRFRRALENTPTAMLVITPITCIRSCAALVLKLSSESIVWPSSMSLVLDNLDAKAAIQKDRTKVHLSLIADANLPHEGSSASLAHAYLLERIQIRVSRERPITLTGGAAGFESVR
jgi:recA bacterial DNA recombination protein